MLRNKRKFIASSLVAVMIMGTIPTEANATFEKTDISGHWAESQISLMGDKGYIGGYPDNTFRPNKEITRAEFVAIVNNVFGYKNKKEIQLKDVKPEAWYYESIAIGINEGYIAGYPDGTFRPNKPVSREEAAAVIAKIKKLTVADNMSSIEKFKDAGKISKWSQKSVESVIDSGYMAGYEDNTFKPEKAMTRAEVASLLSRFVTVNENEETNTENAGKNNSSSGSSSSGGSGSSSSGSKSVDLINPFINGGTFNKEYSLKVTDKATYGSKLPSEINGNIEIKGELSSDKIVNLENLNINGTLTIDVKDAHVNLNNTKANKVNVISCGKNSLEFKGTSGTKELNILDGDGVRIFVNGENVEIGIVEISPTINDAEIKLDGNFGKAEIKVIKPSRIKLNKFSKIEKFTVNSKAIFLNESGNALKAKELCILCENFVAEKNLTEDIKKLSEEITRLRKGDGNSHKSDEVFIPNKYLRKAINNSLGKNLDDAVTQKDMENLTKLSSDFLPIEVVLEGNLYRGIDDLTGLEYATNLEWVDLSENKISDLSPLKNSVNINWLEVDRNYISDLTPLSDMKKLEHLNIYNNAGITDLTPICGLENLKWIDMHHCSRGKDPLNVEKLVTLKNLEYLSIETNLIEDVSFVKEFSNLKTFSCNNTFVTDLEAVQDIAVRSYNDWSGEYFFNMFGQMLKSPVIVNLDGDDLEYRFKSPVKNNEKYKAKVEEVAASYGEEIKAPGFEAYGDTSEFVHVDFDYNTDEIVLKIDPNNTGSERKFATKVLLDYGMYSLKLEFDITQADSSSNENVKTEIKDKNGDTIATLYESGKLVVKNGLNEIPKAAFENNKDVKNAILPDTIKSIGKDAFTGCENLESILIPEGVEFIDEYAFYKCYKLNNIELPSSLKKLEYCAFGSCKSLENLTIKDGIEEIGYSVFLECKSLKSVTIPASVNSIQEWPFSGCDNLENFIVDPNNQNYSAVDGILYDKSGKVLIQYLKSHGSHYKIPDGVTKIAKGAFVDTGIATVEMPESLEIIGFSAFEGCEDLLNVEVPKNVKELDHFAFAYNAKLEKITLPEGLTIIRNNVFNGCESLKNIEIPNTVESIGDNTFSYCNGLEEFTIPNSVKSIGEGTFEDCSNLQKITIDNAKGSVVLGKNCIPENTEVVYLRTSDTKGEGEDTNTNEDQNQGDSDSIEMSDEVRNCYLAMFNKYNKYEKKYVNIVDDKADSYEELPSDHMFTENDMKMLKKFYVSDMSVNAELVSPLQYATNLENFEVLFYGKSLSRDLEKFDFLKNCKNLKILYYLNNGLDSVSDAKSQLNDISVLSELSNLEDVRINMTTLEDITPISNLALKTLVVSDNEISDLNSAINGMTTLERLDVENNKISDISSMSTLESLRSTYLYNNDISDIIPLSNLDKLEALLINGNKIDDISVLEGMNLKRLYINGNLLSQTYIDNVKNINGINTLKIDDISEADFEWLKQFSVRSEENTSDLEENNARLYTFGNMDLEVEADKSWINEGILTITNPLKGLAGEAVLQDDMAENKNEDVVFEGDQIKITLSDAEQDYLEIKYPIYTEDPDSVYGQYSQAASIAGGITLKIIIK